MDNGIATNNGIAEKQWYYGIATGNGLTISSGVGTGDDPTINKGIAAGADPKIKTTVCKVTSHLFAQRQTSRVPSRCHHIPPGVYSVPYRSMKSALIFFINHSLHLKPFLSLRLDPFLYTPRKIKRPNETKQRAVYIVKRNAMQRNAMCFYCSRVV